MERPDHWNPRTKHPRNGSRHIEFQTIDQTYRHPVNRPEDTASMQVASIAFNLNPENTWLRAPTTRPSSVAWACEFTPLWLCCTESSSRSHFTRSSPWTWEGVGRWPQWVAVAGNEVDASDYIEELVLPAIAGYSVVVFGGRRSPDGEHVITLLNASECGIPKYMYTHAHTHTPTRARIHTHIHASTLT